MTSQVSISNELDALSIAQELNNINTNVVSAFDSAIETTADLYSEAIAASAVETTADIIENSTSNNSNTLSQKKTSTKRTQSNSSKTRSSKSSSSSSAKRSTSSKKSTSQRNSSSTVPSSHKAAENCIAQAESKINLFSNIANLRQIVNNNCTNSELPKTNNEPLKITEDAQEIQTLDIFEQKTPITPAKILADYSFLLGRIALKDIISNGKTLIHSGRTITSVIVLRAFEQGKLIELTKYSRAF